MIYALSMMFNNRAVMERGLNRCYTMSSGTIPIKHVLIDQHYPLKRAEVKEFIRCFARDRDCLVLDPGKNLGGCAGWNWACDQLPLEPSDLLIGVDPDSWPCTHGWEKILVQGLNGWRESRIPWVAVGQDIINHKPGAQFRDFTLNGLRAKTPTNCDVYFQSLCAFAWEPLKAIGNFSQPFAYYGDLEKTLSRKYRAAGWEFAWLMDAWDEPRHLDQLEDPEFGQFKEATAHRGEWNGDFIDYLKMRGLA